MASDNSANAVASGKVETSADRKYPAWVRHDLERDYYDKEWGIPITHETGMLERVCLEGFQAGLSWYTVLVKRPVFREVFADFVPENLQPLQTMMSNGYSTINVLFGTTSRFVPLSQTHD